MSQSTWAAGQMGAFRMNERSFLVFVLANESHSRKTTRQDRILKCPTSALSDSSKVAENKREERNPRELEEGWALHRVFRVGK